jgi:hypothetical protein
MRPHLHLLLFNRWARARKTPRTRVSTPRGSTPTQLTPVDTKDNSGCLAAAASFPVVQHSRRWLRVPTGPHATCLLYLCATPSSFTLLLHSNTPPSANPTPVRRRRLATDGDDSMPQLSACARAFPELSRLVTAQTHRNTRKQTPARISLRASRRRSGTRPRRGCTQRRRSGQFARAPYFTTSPPPFAALSLLRMVHRGLVVTLGSVSSFGLIV